MNRCHSFNFRNTELKKKVDALYEYLRTLASHKVNLLTVPPVDLHNILHKPNIGINPRLEPYDDPDRNIWAYFSIKEVTPSCMDDFLLVIPLTDRSLQIDLYKFHNLLHFIRLGSTFSYVLEAQHLGNFQNMDVMLLSTQSIILGSVWPLKDIFACLTRALHSIKT